MTIKTSSILDYQQSELCPEIWDIEGKLHQNVRDFIISCLVSFFNFHNLVEYDKWCTELLIGSSLATYFYKEDTDLDVKIIIDFEVFKHYNATFHDVSTDNLVEVFKQDARSSFYLLQKVPGTNHPLDFYFVPSELLLDLNMNKFDSLYSIKDGIWLKEPVKIVSGLAPSYVLDVASKKAQPYLEQISHDIENAKRTTIDFLILIDYLKSLEQDDLKLLKDEFEKRFDAVNDDLDILLKDKTIIKDLRKKEFEKDNFDTEFESLMGSYNYSDGNLIFKYLQRYGYIQILKEISKRFKNQEVTVTNADELLVLLSGGHV